MTRRDSWDKYGKNWEYYKNPRKKYLENNSIPIEKKITQNKISFGKYKGVQINHIPTDYLEWLLTTNIKEGLRKSVIAVLGYRYNKNV